MAERASATAALGAGIRTFGRDCRDLLKLALPIVVGLVLSASMGLVDSIVVAPLGKTALAAVSISASVGLIFIATLYGLLSATGVLAAQAFGARDSAGVSGHRRAGWRLGLVAGLIASALMAALQPLLPHLGQPPAVLSVLDGYWAWSAATLTPLALLFAYKQVFDAVDRPGDALAVLAAAVPLNGVLSAWLVSGGMGIPPLGLAGTGIGSFAANAAAAAALALLARRHRPLRHWLHAPTEWRGPFQQQRTAGAPMGAQYLCETGANSVAGLMIGSFGAVALAANQITMSVTMTLYMVPLGIAAATGLRIAQAVGANDKARCWRTARAALVIATAWMGTAALALALGGTHLGAAFSTDGPVIATTAALCVAVALMQVADAIQSVSLGALRGLLDTRWPTAVSLGCYWLVALPAAWLLANPLGFGAAGVWWGFGMGLGVAAMALTLRLRVVTAVSRSGPEALQGCLERTAKGNMANAT